VLALGRRNYITTGREAGSNSLHCECFSASYPARSQVIWSQFGGKATDRRRPSGRGHAANAEITVALGGWRSLLATLPETTFFGRYRGPFA
jgi:hypothetical protein